MITLIYFHFGRLPLVMIISWLPCSLSLQSLLSLDSRWKPSHICQMPNSHSLNNRIFILWHLIHILIPILIVPISFSAISFSFKVYYIILGAQFSFSGALFYPRCSIFIFRLYYPRCTFFIFRCTILSKVHYIILGALFSFSGALYYPRCTFFHFQVHYIIKGALFSFSGALFSFSGALCHRAWLVHHLLLPLLHGLHPRVCWRPLLHKGVYVHMFECLA